jgi:hypothetical protein
LSLTVCSLVEPGTRFDPDLVAAEHRRLHGQPRERWETEVVYR